MDEALIYTIGHSDHETTALVELLRMHDISCIVDVRSQPYSRWTPQFNREILAHDLADAGIAYRFLGDALGGRPSNPALYDAGAERPDYRRLEQTPAYREGIDRLLDVAAAHRVAVMCSEGAHEHCHRHLLITQTLLRHGARVLHLQPDGTTVEGELIPTQLTLF